MALASLLLLTLSIPAFASPRIVRLSYVAGDVRIDRNKAAGVEQAILNMPVVEGTRIYSVGDDARLEIEFENGSTMRLVGNAEIAFRQLGLIDNGDKQSVVEMVKGTAYFDVKNHNGDDFRVMLHDRDVTVRKSSHFRIQLEDPETKIAVFNGELELEGQAERVLIKKNETLALDTNDHSRYYLSRQITTIEGDSFDVERLNYIASQARSDAYRYAGVSYGDPYSYGVSDMAYYGSYFYYPGYGYLWRPAGFAIGWDPFGYGAWSYYPGSGWVFVSSYAWGWTPYRYGRWVNVPGRGWCWGPYGGYRHGWYPVPVVYGYGHDGRINRVHGPIPVPWVNRPQAPAGRTIAFGGRPDHDRDFRGGNGQAWNGRDGRDGRDGRNGWNGRDGGRTAGGAITPKPGVIASPGGAITVQGGTLTTQGGAVTTQGGAVKPVMSGNNSNNDRDMNRGAGRGRDDVREAMNNGDRRDNRRPGQVWSAPPVGASSGTPAATNAVTPTPTMTREPGSFARPTVRDNPTPRGVPAVGATPAVTNEPHSFSRPTVQDTPSQRMSAPPVTAPASVPIQRSAPPVTTPAVSAPMRSAPPVSAPAAAPSMAPPVRQSAPAVTPPARSERSPQSSRMSAPAPRMSSPSMRSESFSRGGGSEMRGGGGMRSSGGGSPSSHSSSGGGRSSGGSSNGGGHSREH